MNNHLSELKKNKGVLFIEPSVQNSVIQEYSTNEYYGEFKKLLDTTNESISYEARIEQTSKKIADIKSEKKIIENLRNLIEVLGNMFRSILLSDVSERRVFSVALQDEPSDELMKVINYGVELGYFQLYVIGNKFGTGKARLIILNRILAPHFGLDPSSFAGYKFLNSKDLEIAIEKPYYLISKINSRGVNSIFDDSQQSLFIE
ncbi:MAG: hypothetical protein HYV28_19035 [Ignavibacteriales bacterium]|nr:hypothetical protein [Ignavibacteriales bacterium]